MARVEVDLTTDRDAAPPDVAAGTAAAPASWVRLLFPTPLAVVIASVVCVIAPTVIGILHVREYTLFSPIDEAAHFDYVVRVSNGELPRLGERFDQRTLEEIACRPPDFPGLSLPDCEATRAGEVDAGAFPGSEQYQAYQAPLYYAMTAVLREPIRAVFGVGDFTATRIAGLIYLVLGLCAIYAAARVMGVRLMSIAPVLLILGVSPVVVFSTTTVTNDAPVLLAGGLTALMGALAYVGRGGRFLPALMVLTGVFAALVKTTVLLPIAAVAIALAIAAWVRRTPADSLATTAKRWLPNGGALVLGALAASVVWNLASKSRALVDSQEIGALAVLRSSERSFDVFMRTALDVLRPMTTSYTGNGALAQPIVTVTNSIFELLLMGAGVAGLFVIRRFWPHVLGPTTVAATYLGTITLAIGLWFSYDIDPPLPGRYALGSLALLAIVLAALLRDRWTVIGMWCLSAIAVSATTVLLLFGSGVTAP